MHLVGYYRFSVVVSANQYSTPVVEWTQNTFKMPIFQDFSMQE